MVKNRWQDEIQEGQEKEDEEDRGGAGDANHGPGKRGRRQQQGGLQPQSAGLWEGESTVCVPEEDATDLLPRICAVNLQEDSDLENYMTSVQEDMMEFKLSYEMWRVGRWAVSIPQVS